MIKEYTHTVQMPVGPLSLSSDGDRLIGLWFEGPKHEDHLLKKEVEPSKNLTVFKKVETWLTKYFQGENPTIDFELKPKGSDFRKEVWNMLMKIPYGEFISYGEIANQIYNHTGKLMSAQAVGGAVGHNPISIVIPCHRVVGTNGSLTGYTGGLNVKQQLLELENVTMEKLYIPQKR